MVDIHRSAVVVCGERVPSQKKVYKLLNSWKRVRTLFVKGMSSGRKVTVQAVQECVRHTLKMWCREGLQKVLQR